MFIKMAKKFRVLGGYGYNDYPTFMELERQSFQKDMQKNAENFTKNVTKRIDTSVGSNGYYADKLLW